MVAVALPVFVNVTCCDVLLPTATDPKFKLVADELMVMVVPVPLAVMVVGEFVALLEIEIVADSVVALCGVNVTVAVAVAPGAMVEPFATPVTE